MKIEDQNVVGFRAAALLVLEGRKLKNPSYSLRAFAKNLGMNPAKLELLSDRILASAKQELG